MTAYQHLPVVPEPTDAREKSRGGVVLSVNLKGLVSNALQQTIVPGILSDDPVSYSNSMRPGGNRVIKSYKTAQHP
jgi:hypothetical protein